MDKKENAPLGDSQEGRKSGANNKKSKTHNNQNKAKNSSYPPTTLEEAERALYCIPADCSEDEWKDAGMGFSSEFPDRLDVFDRWSATATKPEKYNAAETKSRWQSWTRKSGKAIGYSGPLCQDSLLPNLRW